MGILTLCRVALRLVGSLLMSMYTTVPHIGLLEGTTLDGGDERY